MEMTPTPPEQPIQKRLVTVRNMFLPLVIIFAGLIVAVAVYVVRIREHVANGSGTPQAVRAVSPSDHIIGNPSAPIVLVEYSDIDSEFGKKLQLTMEQLMTQYVAGNKVAWVYRHFPVTTLHPNASTHALAAECAQSVSTPAMFFRFIDALNMRAPGAISFDPKQYGAVVAELSLPKDSFEKCVKNATFEQRVHDDYSNALAAGATGSPYIILLVQGQKPRQIQGAPPYKALKKILDDEIAKLPQ